MPSFLSWPRCVLLVGHHALFRSEGLRQHTARHGFPDRTLSSMDVCSLSRDTLCSKWALGFHDTWHPGYKKIWPEAFTTANMKGAMKGALWVNVVAETFIHHVRVVRKLEGCRLSRITQ